MINALSLEKRPAWMGAVGATIGIASVVGPVLGGVLTTNVSWRGCFYSKFDQSSSMTNKRTNAPIRITTATVNLPIGAVTLIAVTLTLEPTSPFKTHLTPKQKILQLDPLGTLFPPPFPNLPSSRPPMGRHESRLVERQSHRSARPLRHPPGLLRIRSSFPTKDRSNPVIKEPQHAGRQLLRLQSRRQHDAHGLLHTSRSTPKRPSVSAQESGIRNIPLVLSLVAGSIVSGVATGKIGYYTQFANVSAVVMPVSAGLISTWKVDTGHAEWIGLQVLYGFSLGRAGDAASPTRRSDGTRVRQRPDCDGSGRFHADVGRRCFHLCWEECVDFTFGQRHGAIVDRWVRSSCDC
jgi:hypothetical protein